MASADIRVDTGAGVSVAYVVLLGIFAFIALRYWKTQASQAEAQKNQYQAPPGVSYYCNNAVTQRPQQVQAFTPRNNMQSTQPGYAPAFGPRENMPSCATEVFN
jgi:predicted negative regulator of RcsB-dependent stress response